MTAKKGLPLTKSIESKLLAYCAAASGALLVAHPAEASVVYSGIKDVVIGKSSTIYVDLDNNGSNDMCVFNRYGSHPPLDSSLIGCGMSIMGSQSSSFPFPNPKKLTIGSVISQNKQWVVGGLLHAAEHFGGGLIDIGVFANTSGYIGLKFKINNSIHYGWMQYASWTTWYRTGVVVSGTIYDWAYESTPDTSIKAGQTADPTTTTTSSIQPTTTTTSITPTTTTTAPAVPFTYTVENNQVTINSYTGPLGAVTIPSTINGMPVVGIGSQAFYYRAKITGIILPEGLTSIGANAFQGCTGLTSLVIPNSVKNIGSGAFSGCANITSLSIGTGVESIGMFAFTYCSGLTTVTIPATVISIGQGAFASCGKLRTAQFAGNAPAMEDIVFDNCASGFTVLYQSGALGFTNPWYTYTTAAYNDADQDGIADAVDNCPGVYNPQQLDANGNNIGDCCDPTPGCGGCGQPACDSVCSK